EYWEYVLQHNPTFATYIGDHRYNDALEDLSEGALSAQNGYFKDLLVKTEKVDEDMLTDGNSLNRTLLVNTLTNNIEMFRHRTHYLPLDHMQGLHIDFPQIIEFHPFNTQKDIDDYLSRLTAFPSRIDQLIGLLQKGSAHHITAFKKIIEHVLMQVETFTNYAPEDSPLFSPVRKMKDGFPAQDIEDTGSRVKQAISSAVTPAYKKLQEYLRNEYIRHCREKEGIWSLPDGSDMYRFYVKYHTTTDLSPEEIHETGRREVERIRGEIVALMKSLGCGGSLRECAAYVKGKRELYPRSAEEIMQGYRDILARMDTMLPDYFGRLPRATYDLREIETYREQAAPAAYYYPPPGDFSRPGYFYVNTYNPEQRPTFDMEALACHEAVPGHHLQIAIMQELKDIPDFRRYGGSTAFIEGWALYAEKLSKEMGFYQDVFSEYGRLNNEIWRAARLVVDTGLHFYKWGRDETIQYCRENTGLEEHEIGVEVDRYIAMPGQALAYKTGELKIIQLREEAEKSLGPDFDIKEFHDRLLEHGALPLYILDRMMKEWMERTNRK
ncbi:MAG TPA: DUF885 domain-containing protein, partial [Nitrospiraceae bacterium]|nr:DUF885 domain-containing protein [Nitrospiraceae bacterium]